MADSNSYLTKFAPIYAAQQQYQWNKQAGGDTSRLSNPNFSNLYGNRKVTYNADGSVNVEDSANAGEQGLYNSNLGIRQNFANTAGGMFPQVASAYSQPFDTSNLPGRVSNVQMGNILGQLDTSKIPGIPGAGDLAKMRQEASDAAYRQNTQYMDEQWRQRDDNTAAQLANQGIAQGSEAYDRAMRNANDTKQRDYASARDAAYLRGLNEQQAQYNMGANTNAQLFGQLLQGGQFQNQAQNQGFTQGLQNADLSNTARDAQFQENSYLRQLPMQELQQFLGGSTYNMPDFGGWQGAQVQPGDLEGAVQGVIGQQATQDAAKRASRAQLLGAGLGLIGSGVGGWASGGFKR